MVKEIIKDFYKHVDNVKRYTIKNKERIESILKIYKKYKKYFGEKVLDLCCGGAVLGFILEKEGKYYVGVDINEDMIKEAKKVIKKGKLFLEDVRKFKTDETFDVVTCLGNSLAHLTVFDFIEVLKNVNEMTRKGSYFIIEYRDVIKLLFEERWKKVFPVKEYELKVNFSYGIDTSDGKIKIASFGLESKKVVYFHHTIWSPFILRAIMKAFGWKLVESEEVEEWDGVLEIYERKV